MSKIPYKNLVTIPTSANDPLVDANETVVGGDIVKNFKAIADVIHPESPNFVVEYTSGSGSESTEIRTPGTNCALNVGCNFNHTQGADTSYHILNNTVGNNISHTNLATSGADTTRYGIQSGAFMKGILFNPSDSPVTLLDVPYAGGMLVEYNVLALDNYNNIHVKKGTLYIYTNSYSDVTTDNVSEIGSFSVSNGDLVFTVYGNVQVIQIGLHGTILAGLQNNLATNNASVAMPSSS